MYVLPVAVLLAVLTTQSTAQLSFGPAFSASQYQTGENQQLVVFLSAPILTRSFVPSFNGTIEVDVISEKLPRDDNRQQAELGADYTVNTQDSQSRSFTVTFQPMQSDSSQSIIQIADDTILEGREYFRLRISGIRFNGTAAMYFTPQDGFNNTFVDVSIEDDDFVQVSWTVSQQISVTEGVDVMLRGEVTGFYANPIAIGVECSQAVVTGKQPATPGKDFNFAVGSKLHFEAVGTNRSFSSDQVVVQIINDEIAEPKELFICALKGDTVNAVQTKSPSQVTIEIFDNDELIVRWGKDFHEFKEDDLFTEVELVTDSDIEVDISIQGYPMQIPDGSHNRISPLTVSGPLNPGLGFASIERVQFRGATYGNAQVKLAGRTDVQGGNNDFAFTPTMKSAFKNFTVVDDDVLEFDEVFMAEFDFGPELSNNWNISKGTPSVLYCLIRDDDFVEVDFNEESFTVNEFDGQVNVSLRITGKFFIPVYAIVEISDGTATDPEDYSSAQHYNVTFRQTVSTDQDIPASSAVSLPFSINITDDDILEELEYLQIQIVETSSLKVKIGQRNTINVTIMDDDIKARAVSEDQTVVGRVTQTLTIECKAKVRLGDDRVNFTWNIGDSKEISIVDAANGMATSLYTISELNMEKYHEQTLECHPTNAIGGHNFTQFKISVELFPPPNVTKFAFQRDRKDALNIEWLPVDVTGYPGASVEKYYLELARDKDGSAIVDSTFVPARGNASHVLKVTECSKNYWVRIKAVNGNQDVTNFSGWVPAEAVQCPVITVVGQVIPGWVISLIVFLILLFCLLCLILLCLLLFCCGRRRDPKGVYNAEKREKLYHTHIASYKTLQEHECATLERVS